MSHTINVPQSLSFSNAVKFRDLICELDPEQDYVFDFRRVGHTEPFALLLVSDAIARFRESQLFGETRCRNHEHMTYQGVMGFFRAAGFDYGYAPGEAGGGANYLPITFLSMSDIKQQAEEQFKHEGVIVEERAHRIAAVLARREGGDLCEALTYALREVIRNVVEHSGADEVRFCAQHWPTKNRVHLAILDRGKGIRESLEKNPHLTIDSDIDALKLCLMPGVSGRMFAGVKRRKGDVWQNSGYGLYMTSRLAKAGGNFWIMSGRTAYGITSTAVRERNIAPFRGTALRVSFDTTQLARMAANLARFHREGIEIARHFKGASAEGASIASTMIRTRF